MEKRKTKKEIVKMLLNKNLDIEDEEQLLDLLIDQPIAVDVDKQDKDTEKLGDKVADKLTEVAGSWSFIIGFTLFLILWILLNLYAFKNVDPYPFILLNLVLSCVAALQAPIIMMSQNRAAKKDSMRSQNDYKTDLKSELILEDLHDKMEKIIFIDPQTNEEVEFAVEEETQLNGIRYLLVSEGQESGDCEAYILKEVSTDEEEIVYQMVEDDVEFSALAKIFSELTDDETALEY